MTFAHIMNFHHHHFSGADHTFIGIQSEFVSKIAADIGAEALDMKFVREYISTFPTQSAQNRCMSGRRQALRRQSAREVPKNFYVSKRYSSSGQKGMTRRLNSVLR